MNNSNLEKNMMYPLVNCILFTLWLAKRIASLFNFDLARLANRCAADILLSLTLYRLLV